MKQVLSLGNTHHCTIGITLYYIWLQVRPPPMSRPKHVSPQSPYPKNPSCSVKGPPPTLGWAVTLNQPLSGRTSISNPIVALFSLTCFKILRKDGKCFRGRPVSRWIHATFHFFLEEKKTPQNSDEFIIPLGSKWKKSKQDSALDSWSWFN